MDWAKIWDDICTYFKTNVWNIVWFFAILIIGIILIKILMTITRKILAHTKMERIAQQFICTILKFILWLILILLLLSQLGVEVTGILTACSAVILAVGMALQNAIANVANGIIIISSHMFKKDDYIITGGVEGKISDINFLFTTLITNDNKKITMPNSSLINNEVTNLGAMPKRRVDFMFSVAYESDVELVKKVVTDVMKSNGKIYLDPAPFCRLKVLNASSIDFAANCWCDNADYWDVYYYITENVYNEFKRNNISVPYNQLEIRERKDVVNAPVIGNELPERVEKERPEHEDTVIESFTKMFTIKHKDKGEKSKKKKDKKAKKGEQETVVETQVQTEETVAAIETEDMVKEVQTEEVKVEVTTEEPKEEKKTSKKKSK